MPMKRVLLVLLASCAVVLAETKEQINKSFEAKPGGKLVLDVDFGSVEVTANSGNEVTVDVVRKISRKNKADEEQFLKERPVEITMDDNTVTIVSKAKSKMNGWWKGWQKTEAKYTITVPAEFNAQLKTSGGGVELSNLKGKFEAHTSGGSLRFSHLEGPLNGGTSGGSIRVSDCNGELKVHTSGGSIDCQKGSGSLEGGTSGGGVTVKDFRGPAHVETSGGGINFENVTGRVDGSTSGGSISARLATPSAEEVRLQTSGGSVTVLVPESWAFNLNASTSGGGVSSELPVTVTGKKESNQLRGPVNGGGKEVFLRTSGGSIHVKKL
jgi:hypothetical protein